MFDDKFAIWIINYLSQLKLSGAKRKTLLDQTHKTLLEDQQKMNSVSKKTDLSRLFLISYSELMLAPKDIELVKDLYMQVFDIGGTGSTFSQETLLMLLGSTADPDQIPFWEQMLTLTKPREQWGSERKKIAMAALAFIALQHPSYREVLWTMTQHPIAKLRFEAVYMLGRLNGCLEDMYLIDDRTYANRIFMGGFRNMLHI